LYLPIYTSIEIWSQKKEASKAGAKPEKDWSAAGPVLFRFCPGFRCFFLQHTYTEMLIAGQEKGNLSYTVENVSKKIDCFKLCQDFTLCKWFVHVPSLSLCSLVVEPKGTLSINVLLTLIS
jgi:hypothetical protein